MTIDDRLRRFLGNRKRVRALVEHKRRHIVTMEGAVRHTVRKHWSQEDEATTNCGLRLKDATYLMRAAETLTKTRPCRRCDNVWQHHIPDTPPTGVFNLGVAAHAANGDAKSSSASDAPGRGQGQGSGS